MPADQDIIEDHRAFIMIKDMARIPATGSNSNNKDRHRDSGIAHLLAIMRLKIHLHQLSLWLCQPMNRWN